MIDPNFIGPPDPSARMSVQDMISKLMSEYGEGENELAEMFNNLRLSADAAKSDATKAGAALQAARSAPAPRTSPTSDFLTRGLGSAAALFSGRESPRQLAESLIANQQKELMERRSSELEQLQDTYTRAMERAKKMDDIGLETKLGEKIKKLSEQRQELNELRRLEVTKQAEASIRQAQNAFEGEQARLERTFKRTLTEYEQGELLKRVAIQAGVDPDDIRKPLMSTWRQQRNMFGGAGSTGGKVFGTEESWRDNLRAVLRGSTYKKGTRGKYRYDMGKLRSMIWTVGISPLQVEQGPDSFYSLMADLTVDMDDKGRSEYVFPRDPKTGEIIPLYKKKLVDYVRGYFPNWEGPIEE